MYPYQLSHSSRLVWRRNRPSGSPALSSHPCRYTSLAAIALLYRGHRSKVLTGGSASIIGRHPFALVLRLEHVEMELHLIVQVPIPSPLAEQSDRTGNGCANPSRPAYIAGSHACPGASSNRCMMPAIRSQLRVSVASCRLPTLVRL